MAMYVWSLSRDFLGILDLTFGKSIRCARSRNRTLPESIHKDATLFTFIKPSPLSYLLPENVNAPKLQCEPSPSPLLL